MLAIESLKYLEFCRDTAQKHLNGEIEHNNGDLEWEHSEYGRDRTIKYSYIIESDTMNAMMTEEHLTTKSSVKSIDGYKLTAERLGLLKAFTTAQLSIDINHSLNIETMESEPIRITIRKNQHSAHISIIDMSEKTLMAIQETRYATNKG